MKAYVFPGQGAQFVGMGKDLYDNYPLAKELFEKANTILGFRITDLMFAGTDEDLKQTKVTQPAIFLHSVILSKVLGGSFKPDMVAGHSLGEFSALVANGALSFEDGLLLVSKRALAMQKAGADIIGTNCGNGMERMVEIVREMRAACPQTPILVHANAGLPVHVDGVDTFPETPEDMARQIPALIQAGANIIGGCCGTSPAHIAAIAKAVRTL